MRRPGTRRRLRAAPRRRGDAEAAAPRAADPSRARPRSRQTRRRIAAGKAVFTTNCAVCHRADAGGNIGPNLTGRVSGSTAATIGDPQDDPDGVPTRAMPAWGDRCPPAESSRWRRTCVTLRGTNIPANRKRPGRRRSTRDSQMTVPSRPSACLPTLNQDGTRRWIRPKLAHGQFSTRRRDRRRTR